MRHPLQRRATWLVVLLLLLPSASLAARERTGSICGIVVDELGHGLARARVFLMDHEGTSLLESTHTDSAGRFTFSGLFPQTYQLRAEKPGYGPERIGPLATRPGTMVTAPFVMRPGPDTARAPAVAEAATSEPPDPDVQPARRPTRRQLREEPEGTLAETLAGTNRDALKSLGRPGAGTGDEAGPRRLRGDLLMTLGGSDAGTESVLMAGLAGPRWTVELGRADQPVLFRSTGHDGPLQWRMLQSRSAAFEFTPPEQTFRLQLLERLPATDGPTAGGVRGLSAGWDRRSGSGRHQLGLDLHHAAATGQMPGPGHHPALFLLDGRLESRWSPTHELQFQWRLGSLADGPAIPGLHLTAPAGFSTAPGGVISPLAEGWGSVISGSERWRALEPLQLLCNIEYRVTGGATSSRVARPSMGFVYTPFDRMSLRSNVGLALRSTSVDVRRPVAGDGPGSPALTAMTKPSRRWNRGLEYGVSLEQGFGQGYNLELDLTVEDLVPANPADFDPTAAIGHPRTGGFIALAADGAARTRQMRLALSKEFGRLLSGSLGTSLIHGQGDIQALAALPGDKDAWADSPAGVNHVRGFSGHLDTFLPSAGTGILVTFHRLTNHEPGLLDRAHAPAEEITGLDVGLRQRILRSAGLDLQLLMAISSMALDADSFQGLVDSLVGDASPYRRIVGGLRVHF